MDNLSHALAGMIAGELIHRLIPKQANEAQQKTRHRLLLATGALAGNFPDLDLVLTPLLPPPLGYLLHHRGHTHTLLYAIPQMLLLAAALLLPWAGARAVVRTTRAGMAGFLLTLLAGFGLHLGMDFLNSYGLHPFHPFEPSWFYGDMVFILEPMFWLALGAPLAMVVPVKRWRWFFLLLLLAVPAYFTYKAYLAWYALIALYGVVLLCVLAQQVGKAGWGGPAAGIGMLSLFLLGQAGASAKMEHLLRAALQTRPQAGIVHDIALTAFPSNPFCWNFVSVQSSEEQGTYRLTKGVASMLPQWVAASSCPHALNPAAAASGAAGAIAFIDEASGSLASLRATRARNCYFDAWLRFARIPLLKDGTAVDLRYAASQGSNFSAMHLPDFENLPCPEGVPGWKHPRDDLFDPATVGPEVGQ